MDAAFSINPAVDIGQVRDTRTAAMGGFGQFPLENSFPESSKCCLCLIQVFYNISYTLRIQIDKVFEEYSSKSCLFCSGCLYGRNMYYF